MGDLEEIYGIWIERESMLKHVESSFFYGEAQCPQQLLNFGDCLYIAAIILVILGMVYGIGSPRIGNFWHVNGI